MILVDDLHMRVKRRRLHPWLKFEVLLPSPLKKVDFSRKITVKND